MFKNISAVIATAALLTIIPPGVSAQHAPEPTPSITAPRKPSPTLPNRVFIDVNGGFQSGTRTFTDTRNDPFFGETASWTADYETKSGPTFDVGGGVRVWRNLVGSAAYSRFTDTSVAGLEGGVPHPFFFNRNRAIAGEAVGLKQQEDVVHANAMWVFPITRWLDLRAFGGPSFYRIQRDLVEDIVYGEDGYPYDSATFDSAQVERVKDDAWGFHVGGDITWMFTQAVGLGAMVRFTRAEANITSPANGESLPFRFGGLQYGGGIRFRFGGLSARKEGTKARRSPKETQRTPHTVAPRDTAQAPPTQRESDAPPQPSPKPAVRDTAVLKKDSGVYVRPGMLQPLRVLAAGTRLKVREEAGEWLVVEFKDPQWGARVGYVLRADCHW